METKRVLIVEDSYSIQLLIETILADYGYTLAIASNGEQALKEIESQKPDLLILDIMMPVMDGFLLLEKIRKPLEYPILVVSAKSDHASIERAMQLGATDYIIKPFNTSNLINKVKALLNDTSD